jgi:myo-inositol-1-phosphate synthase
MGAVASTFIAGTLAVRRNLAKPIGSLTQMGTIRLGKRTEPHAPLIRDYIPLANLEDLRFGGWDIYDDSVLGAARTANVLDSRLLDQLGDELEMIRPMPAVFDSDWVRKLKGPNTKRGASKMALAEQLMSDIESFKKSEGCNRCVMIFCASTEVYREPTEVHASLRNFEEGLRTNSPDIAPSQIYAYAALRMGVPYVNGAPNLSVDIGAMQELSREMNTPIAGKDFKTGQTLMKTILAPGFKARVLGLNGWFSTNILGNRDGEVLDDPDAFRSKEVSKLGVLEHILQPHLYPDLYGDYEHKVRINYYKPRGDDKEGWDNIDIFGWLGYPMQIKVDFLCRDSILAAPLVLDLALLMDFAKRSELRGTQEWLSFFFKSPMTAASVYPEHDLFIQLMKLKNTLRHLQADEVITHLGHEYYA